MIRSDRYLTGLGALILVVAASVYAAQEHAVIQKGKAFSVKRLNVKIGDSVKFVNEDPYTHNVFSLSDAKSFDLGSHGQGVSRTVSFDKAGTIEVECAVHPEMRMIVEVSK